MAAAGTELSELILLALAVLVDSSRYTILDVQQGIELRTNGYVNPNYGSISMTLRRLRGQRLVVSKSPKGSRVIEYQITRKGKEEYQRRYKRMDMIVNASRPESSS